MNDNTRRQWDSYCEREVHCPDCIWLLHAFVREHTAATGLSHPGWRRLRDLTHRSNDWIANHLRHLEQDGHIVLVREGRWRGRSSSHDAAAYAIPWLTNSTKKRSPRSGDRSDNRSDNRSTPLPLRGRRGGRAQAPAAPAAPGDATHPPETQHECPDCDGTYWVPATGEAGLVRCHCHPLYKTADILQFPERKEKQ